MRVAPALSIVATSLGVRMPPNALTPSRSPTVRRISETASAVAPCRENPVDVLTKSAPHRSAAWQARVISSSVSSLTSRITFTMAIPAASTTADMSDSTVPQSSSLTAPTLMTMSISSAPSLTAALVSAALISLRCAPEGKPMTEHTRGACPASSSAASLTRVGLTQTVAKL